MILSCLHLLYLAHFDILCDLLPNRPIATWNLFVLYNDQKIKKTNTHTFLIPLDLTWCYCWALFKSCMLLFISASSSSFSLSYLHTVSSKRFSCSKQNNGKNNGNCCEDFLWFSHSQEVTSSASDTSSDTGHWGQNSLINGLIDKQQKYIHIHAVGLPLETGRGRQNNLIVSHTVSLQNVPLEIQFNYM